MRKLVFLLLTLCVIPSVLAHESSEGIGPDSAFWSADLFFEKLNLWLTFDPAERVRINLAHAEERVEEAEHADARARAVAQREIDVTRAQAEFSGLSHPETIGAEIKAYVEHHQTDDETFTEQDDAWAELLADVETTHASEVESEIEVISNQITGAVVADETVEAELVDDVDPEEVVIDVEPIIPVSTPLRISAFVQGGEVTRLNISINGEIKKLTLAITDYNATIKEVMKRYNLSYPDVRKAMIWKEE